MGDATMPVTGRQIVQAAKGAIARRLTQLASPGVGGGIRGLLAVGPSSVYNATAWDFQRVANAVYANPTGYRCVEAIVNNFSRPEWQVRKPGEDDGLDNHPLLAVLNKPTVPVGRIGMTTSGTSMQRKIARDMELTGKTFWLKMRGRDGFGDAGPVTGLRRMPPQRVTIVGNEDDDLLGFVYTDRSGARMAVLPESVVYVRYPHPERDYDGLAPALMAGLPAESDNAAQRFNYDLLANDGALPGYIMLEGLSIDQFNEWKAAWESGEYPGKTRFLGGQASYVKVGQSNKDMMQDMLRDYSQKDIMKAFGVPPVHAFDLSNETYANADAEKDLFIQQTVLSKWTLVSDEFTVQLGEEAGVEIGFDLDDIEELQESEDAATDRAVKLVDSKMITINEWREEKGKPPVEWGDKPAQPVAPMAPAENPADGAPVPVPPQGGGEASPEEVAKQFNAKGYKAWKALHQVETGVAHPAWHDFDRRLSSYEARTMRKMQLFFARQGRVIEAKLRAGSGKSLQKAMAVSKWWDAERWNFELTEDAATFLGDTIDAFGTHVLSQLAFGPMFDTGAAAVQQYITQRSTGLAKLVNDTTEQEVRDVIAAAEATGAGIDEIARAAAGYFEDHGTQRAELVARTECIGAANFATVQAAQQSGIAVGKTWLATADERTDSDCALLDGTTVGLDESFDEVDYPPLHPNCRCTVLIETDDGQTTEEGGDE